MALFMKISGITGDTLSREFQGDFDILSFAFGAQRPISTTSGGGAGKLQLGPVVVTLASSEHAPLLLSALGMDTLLKQVTIYTSHQSGDGSQSVAQSWTLKNCFIESFNESVSGASTPFIGMNIVYQQLEYKGLNNTYISVI